MAVALLVLAVAGCGPVGSAPGATLSGAPSSSTATGQTRVLGRVLAGPACPVQRAESPCPDRPVAGARVVVRRDGRVVAATATATDGSFTLAVPAGRVVVTATNPGGYPSTDDQVVTVPANGSARVTLHLDTGIR